MQYIAATPFRTEIVKTFHVLNNIDAKVRRDLKTVTNKKFPKLRDTMKYERYHNIIGTKVRLIIKLKL